MEDGTEEYIQAMLPDKLPNAIQKLYDASHNKKMEQIFCSKAIQNQLARSDFD